MTLFHNKSPAEIRNKGMYLKILETVCDRPIANITLNGEKLKPLFLKLGIRQQHPLSPLLISIIQKFLARAIGKRKK
jgi:hypothetical protein